MIYTKAESVPFRTETNISIQAQGQFRNYHFAATSIITGHFSSVLTRSFYTQSFRFHVFSAETIAMADKSKIIIIGGTGNFGKCIVEATARLGHPTFALIRESTISNPSKWGIIESFKSSGVNLVTVSTPVSAYIWPFWLLLVAEKTNKINLEFQRSRIFKFPREQKVRIVAVPERNGKVRIRIKERRSLLVCLFDHLLNFQCK